MQIQLVHDHFDTEHLSAVMSEMRVMGAPTIKAVDIGENVYAALEGCHRIRAAIELGLQPIIEEVEYSDDSVETVVPGQFQDDLNISNVVDRCHTNPTAFFDENPRIVV